RRLETEGEIDIVSIKSEAQRIQEEREAQHAREQDEKQREYERQKEGIELDHQQALDRTKTQYELDIQMYRLVEGYKQQVHVREETLKDAQHQALLDKYTW